MSRSKIIVYFAAVAFATIGNYASSAAKNAVPLERLFELCEAYVLDDPTIEELTTYVRDEKYPAISYGEVNSDAGLVTVKVEADVKRCWVMGAKFTDTKRITTISWVDAKDRSISWLDKRVADATADGFVPLDVLRLDEGVSVSFCIGKLLSHKIATSSGGTDDEDRAMLFSSAIEGYEWRECAA
ncbi:hypothetical protein [uncultured Tateyamaria sp.]|uniref:hypothetical protein n=1 Tax=uncultured Tateyamaria sp. TaxID=455651 RepID=UPI002617131E|nr:hypothetical protein [uncultured Tateyamaria sp.]